ncbi:MAG TPA: ABC transporter permease [Chloroflexota bacterium]|jgi:peptide/nickel transport system permease protein
MLKYFLKRLGLLIPIVVGVSVVVFVTMRLLPGDVASAMLGNSASASPERLAQLRAQLGLDRPMHEQYADWVIKAVRGDLGASMLSSGPVSPEIMRRLPVTVELALFSIVTAIIIGVPLGVLSAMKQNTAFDVFTRLASLIWLSVPGFWVATILVLLASIYVPTWPTLGYVEFKNDPIGNLKTMVLPTIALSAYVVGGTLRMTRSAMLEVLRLDYITAARARGGPERVVVFKHALKNALIPVITLIGLYLGSLLGGAVLIETIFTLPGLGKLLIDAIQGRDYPLVQGTVLFLASSVVLVNLLVDMLYGAIDPRVRYD